jgi:hypothetical protein
MMIIKIFLYMAVKPYTIKTTLSKNWKNVWRLVCTVSKVLIDHDLNSEQRVIKFIVLSHSW